MARDKKLPRVEIKREDFGSKKQEAVAHEIVETWEEDGPMAFRRLAEKYGTASESLYGQVYEEYLGPPDVDLTVEAIRARYESVSNYLDAELRGEVDKNRIEMTERELDIYARGYSNGKAEGYNEGWENALEHAEQHGLDDAKESN